MLESRGFRDGISMNQELHALISGLTKRQRDVLGQIAMSCDSGHHPRVLAALLRQGLIEEGEEVLPGRLPVTVKRYRTPIAVHIAWCEWCSRHCPLP